MPNQKGVVHLLLLLILVVGLVAGIWLVQNRTNFLPKASTSSPITPNAGFELSVQNQSPNVGDIVAVKLIAHSDIDASNLFKAKITFDKNVLAVDHIDTSNSFVKNWVEQTSDNNTGTTSLVGGVPNPGFKTTSGAPMAIIYFKALAKGSGALTFVSGTNGSAIYRNLDNADIASVFSTSGPINVGTPLVILPTATPSPTPAPSQTPSGSRVFVTSTRYDGNLGGLSGADTKCQDRANAAKLGGNWKAWLSDSTTSADSRLNHSSLPYKLVNGTIIADNWAQLTSGALSNKISVDESGNPVSGGLVWTGTTYTGAIDSRGRNCKNWTATATNNDPGLQGYASGIGSQWTDYASSACVAGTIGSTLGNLYCFEHNGAPAPSATPIPGKGDGNDDGKIDLVDMSVLHTDWGKTKPTPGFRAGIDMNGDGVINVFDFGLLRNLLIQKGVISGS